MPAAVKTLKISKNSFCLYYNITTQSTEEEETYVWITEYCHLLPIPCLKRATTNYKGLVVLKKLGGKT